MGDRDTGGNTTVNDIHHVSLDVADLDAAVEFYELLGLEPIERPDALGSNGTWLGIGTSQIHLVVNDEMGPPSAGNHVAFAVADMEAMLAHLRANAVDAPDPFDIGAGRQCFVKDPSGNLIELNQPNS